MQHPIEHFYDALIIGSGAAGLSLALRLAPYCQVLLLSKGPLNEGATYYAQGGIAAVLDEEDSLQAHIQDTLIAGAGLCEPERVEFVVRNARQCITWLIDQGVMFDTEHSASDHLHFHLAQEGGHCHRRILHTADTTGKSVTNTLIHQVQTHSNIRILEHCHAIDLITSHKVKSTPVQRVMGAYIWCCQQQKIATVYSKVVVLATGGASHVYQYTTNPNIASGDGIAMAWRAGCRVANLEFNQFHPTCLYHPQARNFLLTEALRGEGAVLRLPDGHRFMPAFDARAELAPRDIVARAIDQEMKRLGSDALYLDISHRHPDFIVQHFPNLYHKLKALGFDLAQTAIPVVPAAHYTCGGVMVDRHGQSDLRGLYAIGEVSYTGLHGANRLGSNSLLECLVYAWSSATHIIQQLPQLTRADRLPPWDESQVRCAEEAVLIQHNWHELRLLMWDYVGIVRTTERLQRALRRIELLQQEVQEYYSHFHISTHLLELRNLVQVAKLMVHCALSRQESRGLHYTLDYPQQQLQPKPTILQP